MNHAEREQLLMMAISAKENKASADEMVRTSLSQRLCVDALANRVQATGRGSHLAVD